MVRILKSSSKKDENLEINIKEFITELSHQGIVINNSENFDEAISKGIELYCSKFEKQTIDKRTIDLPIFIKNEHKWQIEFENRLYEHWKKPFDLLEFFIHNSLEVGRIFNEKNRPFAAKNNDYVFEALIRLHAHACLVSQEILVLMKRGYADGANARWLTLNEIAVISFFIKKHGNDVAERYLLYQYIESCKAMREYQKYASRLGYSPYSDEEIENMVNIRKKLIERFGRNFSNNNGWAAEILKKNSPQFIDLAQTANLDHLYPLFKMASNAVHATCSKGLYFKLGDPSGKVMQAGPSNYGMADPGQNTAISLLHVNVALLNIRPNLENLATMKAMQPLLKEIKMAFIEAQKSINPDQFKWE